MIHEMTLAKLRESELEDVRTCVELEEDVAATGRRPSNKEMGLVQEFVLHLAVKRHMCTEQGNAELASRYGQLLERTVASYVALERRPAK
jgi:hypothetical protein